jgi:voltage-gated potassium channel
VENVIYLFLRRMRAPLIVLIAAYSVSVGGLVLIPGVDGDGNPWRMDFFHAFYFVSFMGSTIGFGEIPYAFTAAQRLWVSICIFLCVLAWLYAIGRIFTLIQDPAFRLAMREARFILAVRAIKTPFHIVCGYGETGSLLVRALARRNFQCVVIDREQEHLNALVLESLGIDVPAFCGDVSHTQTLIEAGLRKSLCESVVAVTDSDDANVKTAITAKLLHPSVKVICRSNSQAATDNMASFNTDHIINAYEAFGEHLAMAMRTPSVHLLHAWLISLPGKKLHPPVTPPYGKWVICGYGRFGQAVRQYLEQEGNQTVVIEQRPELAPPDAVIGPGTEAGPLLQAGIRDAVGIVVGIDSDTNTLSAIMTARALNPKLYTVARQERRADTALFQAAKIDLVMEPSRIIVWRMLPLITTPMLTRFLRMLRSGDERHAHEILEQVRAICRGMTPQTWSVEIGVETTPAVQGMLDSGQSVTVGDLLRERLDRDRRLPALALMHTRGADNALMPEAGRPLATGDRILFCGRDGTRRDMEWVLYNTKALEYVVTGIDVPDGVVWRWLSRRRSRPAGGADA